MLIFAPVLIFLGLYTPYIYLKRAYNIAFDTKKLIFKSAFDYFEISWNDIENIRITGKVYFKFIFPYPMEGVLIKTKNREINLYDLFYVKSHQIKYALNSFYKEGKFPDDYKDKKIPLNKIRFEKFTIYKGNPVFSFRGLLTWGVIVFFVVMTIISPSKNNAEIVFVIIGGLWLIISSIFMNYYGLSENYLVIKNHFIPWKNRIYDLSDIIEIVYESPDKWPNSLRVITKKFQSKIFAGGTLRDNTWREMKNHFEKNGIKVRDECIF